MIRSWKAPASLHASRCTGREVFSYASPLGALEPQAKALQLLYQVTGKAVVYSVAIPDLLKSLWESGQMNIP